MVDEKNTVLQIFGCLLKNPSILGQTDKYILSLSDFSTSFERKLFATIYSLYEQGAKNVGIVDIDNFIKDSPSSYAIWEKEHGVEYLQDAEELSDLENFDYYYNKLKKINVLKTLKKQGYDISQFYEEDTLNPDYQKINERFETLTAKDIINSLRKNLISIEQATGINQENKVNSANYNIAELVKNLKSTPDTGPRLQGKYFNTIVRGARAGKFFLRSAASGVGKTRNMVGDACYLAYPIRYNDTKGEWEWGGGCEKVLYIATEQEQEEIQTMILSYISGVNENSILYGMYNEEEEDRIKKAIWVMETYKDNLQICQMPNPNIEQVRYVVRSQVLEHDIQNVFYDYIFSNPALLNEFRDLRVREDVALGLFSSALKDLAVELNIFIMTATQLNANGEDATRSIKNESAIRGARSIVDKVDMGCIMCRPTEEELNILGAISYETPNLVTDVYKMRRGRYTQVRIWSIQDLGTCRKEDLFVTNSRLEIVDVFNLKQEYLEDNWNICKNVNKLNNNTYLDSKEVEVSEKVEEIGIKLEEKRKDIFSGLL